MVKIHFGYVTLSSNTKGSSWNYLANAKWTNWFSVEVAWYISESFFTFLVWEMGLQYESELECDGEEADEDYLRLELLKMKFEGELTSSLSSSKHACFIVCEASYSKFLSSNHTPLSSKITSQLNKNVWVVGLYSLYPLVFSL